MEQGKCQYGQAASAASAGNSVLLTDYDRPILVIYGDQDDVVNFSDIEAFCTKNPKAVLKVISGADHRFKGKDELERVIELSEKYILLLRQLNNLNQSNLYFSKAG